MPRSVLVRDLRGAPGLVAFGRMVDSRLPPPIGRLARAVRSMGLQRTVVQLVDSHTVLRACYSAARITRFARTRARAPRRARCARSLQFFAVRSCRAIAWVRSARRCAMVLGSVLPFARQRRALTRALLSLIRYAAGRRAVARYSSVRCARALIRAALVRWFYHCVQGIFFF